MLGPTTLAAAAAGLLLLATTGSALPVESPLEVFKRAATPGVVISKCSQPGVLALAYDDGPHTYTSQLVDILDKAGAKGTFFWTGTLYGCIYSQKAAVKKAFASGHQVASHTWYVSLFETRGVWRCWGFPLHDGADPAAGPTATWAA